MWENPTLREKNSRQTPRLTSPLTIGDDLHPFSVNFASTNGAGSFDLSTHQTHGAIGVDEENDAGLRSGHERSPCFVGRSDVAFHDLIIRYFGPMSTAQARIIKGSGLSSFLKERSDLAIRPKRSYPPNLISSEFNLAVSSISSQILSDLS